MNKNYNNITLKTEHLIFSKLNKQAKNKKTFNLLF